MKDSFIFYRSYAEAIMCLPDSDTKLRLLNAIIKYALEGKESDLKGVEQGMFALIKPQLKANNARYENGLKGGRKSNLTEIKNEPNTTLTETKEEPKPNLTKTENKPNFNQNLTKTEPNQNQTESKLKPNENVNVNDNVNVNENDNYNNNLNLKESKKESKKEKDLQRTRETYDEILDQMEVYGNYREYIYEFIRHLQANGIVMVNSRLESLVIALDLTYQADEEKVEAIRHAINCGYMRLECEK